MPLVGRSRGLESQIKFHLEEAQLLIEKVKEESKSKRKKVLAELAGSQLRSALKLLSLGVRLGE
jgi:hypothetical protein